jgi:hypothetical protein
MKFWVMLLALLHLSFVFKSENFTHTSSTRRSSHPIDKTTHCHALLGVETKGGLPYHTTSTPSPNTHMESQNKINQRPQICANALFPPPILEPKANVPISRKHHNRLEVQQELMMSSNTTTGR